MINEGKKPLKCDRCDYVTWDSYCKIKRHIASVHEGKKPYKCVKCKRRFTQNQDLKRHIQIVHEGKKPFKCNICNTDFSVLTNLKRHTINVHEGKKSFKIESNEAEFSTQTIISRHFEKDEATKLSDEKFDVQSIMLNNFSNKFKCLDTFFKFFEIPGEKYGETSIINITCLKCLPNTFMNTTTRKLSLSNLEKHIKTLHTKDFVAFKEIILSNKTALEESTNSNKKSKELLECEICDTCFQSDLCDTSFGSEKGFINHIVSVHDEKSLLKCDICKDEFSDYASLTSHVESCHLNSKPFQCAFCGECFEALSEMNKHIKTHKVSSKTHKDRGNIENQFECKICNVDFSAQFILDEHTAVAHERKNTIDNDIDGENLKVKDSNTLVHEEKEIKEINEVDDEKNKSEWKSTNDELTTSKSKMKMPVKKENSIGKSYPSNERATIIQKYFEAKYENKYLTPTKFISNLSKDGKKVRKSMLLKWLEEESPYQFQCKLCPKKFKRKWHLQEHIVVVHEEKAFECDICNLKFSLKRALANHYKRKHA